jgi:hypothetical protein
MGFFSSPPEPVLHDDTGTLEVPPWPQVLYLLRVAGDQPGEVLQTAASIPATDNVLVNGNLAELALQFPAGEAARLVPRVIASLDARFGVLDPVGVGRLCRHLADGGRPADALVLTEALLTRLPGSRGSRAVMDTWSFAEVLRTSVPAVARACGLPAVSLLARVLDEAVTAQTPSGLREARRDNSGWWRPSIEGQPTATDTDPASALVSALRDACAEALPAGADLAAVIAEIESHDWPVFRRLALFLLSEHAGHGDGALVGARLCDAAVIQDPGLDREFLLLARRRCAVVGARDRERLLALIDRGPKSRSSSYAGNRPPRKRGPGSAGGSATGSRRSSPCSRPSGSPATVTSWPSSARPPSSPRPCPPSGVSSSAARWPPAISRRPQRRTW